MTSEDDYCIRNYEVDLDESNTVELKFFQRLESDVNGVIWDASLVLANYIMKQNLLDPNKFKNKNVIELGAGLGCPGMTAACLGANVFLTDLEENLDLLQFSVDRNSETLASLGSVTVNALSWSKTGAENLIKQQTFDLILLSDCIYYEESIDPLIDTLQVLCSNDSKEILICQELRESKRQIEFFKGFLSKLAKLFSLKEIPFEKHSEECRSEDIVIYSCRKNDCQIVVPFV